LRRTRSVSVGLVDFFPDRFPPSLKGSVPPIKKSPCPVAEDFFLSLCGFSSSFFHPGVFGGLSLKHLFREISPQNPSLFLWPILTFFRPIRNRSPDQQSHSSFPFFFFSFRWETKQRLSRIFVVIFLLKRPEGPFFMKFLLAFWDFSPMPL